MSEPWALGKEEKVEEVWPSLCEKNSQGAQKETGPGYLRAAKTKQRDHREVHEIINWELDSLGKHAYGHKE